MAQKKRGLGRGLGALIPPGANPTESQVGSQAGSTVESTGPSSSTTAPTTDVPVTPVPESAAATAPVSGDDLVAVPARYLELPLEQISANPRQPRQVFDEEALAELVHSISQIGLLQPVVVRPVGDTYELVAGERRWRAAQQVGLETIPAIIRETPDDELLRDALLENLHRANLNALEEAAAYQQLLDDFGCTQDELARRIGRSRPQVSNTIRLLRLPPEVARRVAAGVLSAGHARAILSLNEETAMEDLARRVVAEGLSVRATEEIVAVGTGSPKKARAKRGAKSTPVEVVDLVDRVSEALETRVTASSRRLVIEFGSIDDLRRIVELIAD